MVQKINPHSAPRCNRSPLLCIFKRCNSWECSVHFFRGPCTIQHSEELNFNIFWRGKREEGIILHIILDWFLGAMLVPGLPPFMSDGFMGVIMIQYFMNYSIGKECYVFISFNIRPYNGKLQSLVTPLPFRDFWWNWISLVSSWNERGQWNYETTRHNQWTLLIRTVEFLVSSGLNRN